MTAYELLCIPLYMSGVLGSSPCVVHLVVTGRVSHLINVFNHDEDGAMHLLFCVHNLKQNYEQYT